MYELDKTKFGAFVARLRREKSILRKSWPHPSKECPPLFVLLRFCRHMKKGMAKSRPYPFLFCGFRCCRGPLPRPCLRTGKSVKK